MSSTGQTILSNSHDICRTVFLRIMLLHSVVRADMGYIAARGKIGGGIWKMIPLDC